MDKDETSTVPFFPEQRQVFVIRLWPEPREIDGKPPRLRGVIEYVSTGEKKYIQDLDELTRFIIPFVEQMGIQLS